MNGCFWHGHNVALPRKEDVGSKMDDEIENSECCKIPKTNREFWVARLALHYGMGVRAEAIETGRDARIDSVYPEPYLVAGSWGKDGSLSESGRGK